MKKLVFLVLSSFLFLSQDAVFEKEILHQLEKDKRELAKMSLPLAKNYPIKTAAYWTSPIMRRGDAINLARHDLVIVDLENKFNNRHILLELKKMNPSIIILAYSNPMEIFLTKYSNRPWQNQVIDEISKNRQTWLLKTIDQKKRAINYANFWPNMVMLNMSTSCPKIQGERYYEWIARKIQIDILSDPIFSGYFQDNGTVNISWVYQNRNEKIDIDGDNKPESDAIIDKKWAKGQKRFLAAMRHYGNKRDLVLGKNATNSEMVIISNKGDLNLLRYVKGKFFEKFPNDYLGEKWAYGWRQSLSNAKQAGNYTILQVERNAVNFGLASALLLDNVYLAVGQDDAGIFPEFEINPGKALGPMKTKGVTFSRQYTNLEVKVEPLQKNGEIKHNRH